MMQVTTSNRQDGASVKEVQAQSLGKAIACMQSTLGSLCCHVDGVCHCSDT
jgi:hypothetical protein